MRNKTLTANICFTNCGTIRGGSFISFVIFQASLVSSLIYCGRIPL